MKLHFYVKDIYGKPMVYASDREVRINLQHLTKTLTLRTYQLKALEALGHQVEIQCYSETFSTIAGYEQWLRDYAKS